METLTDTVAMVLNEYNTSTAMRFDGLQLEISGQLEALNTSMHAALRQSEGAVEGRAPEHAHSFRPYLTPILCVLDLRILTCVRQSSSAVECAQR
jgi:hypothetical protein